MLTNSINTISAFILYVALFPLSGNAQGLYNVTSVDTSRHRVENLTNKCISFIHERSSRINENCTVNRVDTVGNFEGGYKWYLLKYRVKEIPEDSSKEEIVYPAEMLVRRYMDDNFVRVDFAMAGQYNDEYLIKEYLSATIYNSRLLIKIAIESHPMIMRYRYRIREKEGWQLLMLDWKDNMDNLLPKEYHISRSRNVDISDMTIKTNVFDRKMSGQRDKMRDAEELGKVKVNLSIRNNKFIVDGFCFSKTDSY